MTGDVQLPDMIDPDAPHLEFRANQCRECGAVSTITLVANPEWWQWGDDHMRETGHTKFFQWSLTRNTGQIVSMPAPRARRRTLGTRGQ